jgi:hypothetical protein
MGYLREQFKKATLSLALATTLVTGLGTQSAFAQQAGPPPQPSNNGAPTEQVTVPVKPWANDPNYIRQVQSYERQEEARMKAYKAQERAQFTNLDANYQAQQANMLAQLPVYQRQGMPGMMRYGAYEEQINANYNAARIQYKANWDNIYAREDAQHDQYVLNLDLQFGNQPQYKNQGYNPGGKAPATVQPAQPVRPGVSLTTEQQHDRLVKAYQDAQLQSAQSGGKVPMPDPAKYGLDAKDPAIQPVRVGPGGQ